MSETETRRRVLELGLWGILAAAGVALAAVAASAAIGPAFVKRKKNWLYVAQVDRLSDDPQRFDLIYMQRQGWHEQRKDEIVYAYRDAAGEAVLLSPVCTHLGCTVRWEAASKQFHCPCHGGVYDAEGRVVSGPPERPLAKPEVQVENGRILMLKA